MTESCPCLNVIHSHFILPITQVIQAYLHSPISEDFYKKHYDKFTFCVLFNTKINAIEDVKLGYLLNGARPLPKGVSLAAEIRVPKIPHLDNSHYLNIEFLDKGDHLQTSICLSENILLSNDTDVKHDCSTFYTTLMTYFNTDSKTLLDKIERRCHLGPDEKAFKCFWEHINTMLRTWNSHIDTYPEIHR